MRQSRPCEGRERNDKLKNLLLLKSGFVSFKTIHLVPNALDTKKDKFQESTFMSVVQRFVRSSCDCRSMGEFENPQTAVVEPFLDCDEIAESNFVRARG
jgi:hypothetical protein